MSKYHIKFLNRSALASIFKTSSKENDYFISNLLELDQLLDEKSWTKSQWQDFVLNSNHLDFILMTLTESSSVSLDPNSSSKAQEKDISKGFLLFTLNSYDQICHLLKITICSDLRGQKLSSRLMQEMIDFLRRQKTAFKVFLECRVDNKPALGLYEKFSIEAAHKVSGFYSSGHSAYRMLSKTAY